MKKITLYISIIIILFLNISACAYAEIAQPQQRRDTNYKSNDNKYGTDQSPIVIKIKNTPESQKISDQSTEYQYIQSVSSERLVIITIVLALAAIFQWGVMLWQARLMKKSVEATEIAAKAAKDSADALPIAERAYLAVIHIRADMDNWKNAKDDELSPIEIGVCNHGRTPAKITEIITRLQIDKRDGITISRGTPDIGEIIDAPSRLIGRNYIETFSYDVRILSLVDEWNGLGEGDYYINFAGEVRYKDIFEKDHIAYFDWILDSKNYQRGFFISSPTLNYTT
jgi:hypothetical protein